MRVWVCVLRIVSQGLKNKHSIVPHNKQLDSPWCTIHVIGKAGPKRALKRFAEVEAVEGQGQKEGVVWSGVVLWGREDNKNEE